MLGSAVTARFGGSLSTGSRRRASRRRPAAQRQPDERPADLIAWLKPSPRREATAAHRSKERRRLTKDVTQCSVTKGVDANGMSRQPGDAIPQTSGGCWAWLAAAVAAPTIGVLAWPTEALSACPPELPALTVCSPVTGVPLPWGPLGPLGLVVAIAVLLNDFRDVSTSDESSDRKPSATLKAFAGALVVSAAAVPRTQGGLLAAAVIFTASPVLGIIGSRVSAAEQQASSSALRELAYAALIAGVAIAVWCAAGLDHDVI